MSTATFPRFGSTPATGLGPIDDAALRRLVPSAFAPHKHESRSERYTYIPTSAVIDGLRANGFEPTFAKQGRSRIPGKADFTKHLIRFRRAGQAPALRARPLVLEPRRFQQLEEAGAGRALVPRAVAADEGGPSDVGVDGRGG